MKKALFFSFLCVFSAFAQSQSFDSRFVPSITAVPRLSQIATVTGDGIYVIGKFQSVNGNPHVNIVKLKNDGTTDEGFDVGEGFDNSIFNLYTLASGKILVMGNYEQFRGQSVPSLVRLNADGTLDSSFDMGAGPGISASDDLISWVHELNDGKLLVAGNFLEIDGFASPMIARLEKDGAVDQNFTSAGIEDLSFISGITVQADGRIVVNAFFRNSNMHKIIRINTDGSQDNTFTSLEHGLSTGSIRMQSNGKIVIAANGTLNGTEVKGFMRLNTDGTVDDTFDVNEGISGGVNNFYVNGNDEIILSGTGSFDGNQLGFLSALSPDGGFDRVIATADNRSNNIHPQRDGSFFVSGSFTQVDGHQAPFMVRFNEDQTVDEGFSTEIHSFSGIQSHSIDNEGNIYVAGSFRTDDKTSSIAEKVSPEGTIISSFDLSQAFGAANVVKVLSNGAVAFGGSFYWSGGEANPNRLVIIQPDGSFNSAFDLGTGFDNGGVQDIAEQEDGKLLVGGYFQGYKGTTTQGLVRLNIDGSLDETFKLDDRLSNLSTNVIRILPEGRVIIAAGAVYNGVGRSTIWMLNADGSLIDTFEIGSGVGANSIWDIEPLPQGGFLVGGSLSGYNGLALKALVKIDENGVVDQDFSNQISFGLNPRVTNIVCKEDKIYLAGGIDSFNNKAVNGLVRINMDGSIDESFDINTSFDTEIWGLTIQDNNDILMTGTIVDQKRPFASSMAKMSLPPDASPSDLQITALNFSSVSLQWSDNSSNEENYLIQRSVNDDQNYEQLAMLEADATSFEDTEVSELATYFYRVIAARGDALSESTNEVKVVVPQEPLAAPTDLTADEITYQLVILSWTDNSDNETGFTIERAESEDGPFTEIGSVDANVTTYTDNDVEASDSWFYRVAAVKNTLLSDYTGILNILFPGVPPAAPSDLMGTVISPTQINLSWQDNSDNEELFSLERAVNDGDFELLARPLTDATTYEDFDVTVAQKLEYRIQAFGNSAFTEFSNVLTLVIASLEGDLPSQDFRFDFTFDQHTKELTFGLNASGDKIIEANIINSAGVSLAQPRAETSRSIRINLSQATSGVYLLAVSTAKGKYVVRFMIQD